MINSLYESVFKLFIFTNLKHKNVLINIVTFAYVSFTLLASYFQYKLLSPVLWEQEYLYLRVAIYIGISYVLANLAQLLANFASSMKQILIFRTLDKRNIQRAHLERDIRNSGEIHNIFSSLLSASVNLVILGIALFNIGLTTFFIYLLVTLLNWYLIRICHRYVHNADTRKRHWRDYGVSNIHDPTLLTHARTRELTYSWATKKYLILSRTIANLCPLLSLLCIVLLNYFDYITIQPHELLSLILITSLLVDVADNFSMIASLFSKMRVSLQRIDKVTQNILKNSEQKLIDIKGAGFFYSSELVFKAKKISLISNLKHLLGSSFFKDAMLIGFATIFILFYGLTRWYLDYSVASEENLNKVFILAMLIVPLLILADYIFKLVCYRGSIVIGNNLIFAISNVSRLDNKTEEAYSHDLSLIDEGIAQAITEGLYAFSTVIISCLVYLYAGGSYYALCLILVLFYFVQKYYRKVAITTKRMEIRLSCESATSFIAESNQSSDIFISSITAQFVNTLNNRIFMIVIGIITAIFIASLQLFNSDDMVAVSTQVAVITLFIKLSGALSYAVRYFSQLEGWSISIENIANITKSPRRRK